MSRQVKLTGQSFAFAEPPAKGLALSIAGQRYDLVRFLERQHGVDIEGIRAALTVGAIDKAAAFGCGTVKLGNGARLKLNGDVASTCLGKWRKR